MGGSQAEKIAQWREHLERVYGKGAFVSKRWLRAKLRAREGAASVAGMPAAQSMSVADAGVVDTLEKIRADLGDCARCKLAPMRTNLVFGEGSPTARLMFIGEGPGSSEDAAGRPFVGPAGQLLDKIVQAMGLSRAEVYIANVVKCRPPSNRVPEPDEAGACEPFLFRQIDAINPDVLVALGGTALKCLFGESARITQMRGNFIEFRGRKLMPTFHPAYLLRNPESKREVWDDMKKVKAELLRGERK